MGLTMMVSGYFGSLLFARLLDRTKKYKLLMLVNTAAFLVLLILFAWFVHRGSVWLDHLLLGLMGIFGKTGANLTVQYGIELSYPQSVPTMAGLTALAQQLLSLVCAQIGISQIVMRHESRLSLVA